MRCAAKADRQSQPDKTLLLPSGGHYTGSFIVDTLRLHGAGVEFDSAGAEIRRGEWREGSFRSGWGLILSSDGQSRYVGSVHKGLKHGRGTLTDLRSGAVIEADWIDGVAAAGAVAAHGSRFEGQLSPASHLPHGFGARRTAQGAIEIGEFAEGVLVRSCAVLCPKLTIRTLVPPQGQLCFRLTRRCSRLSCLCLVADPLCCCLLFAQLLCCTQIAAGTLAISSQVCLTVVVPSSMVRARSCATASGPKGPSCKARCNARTASMTEPCSGNCDMVAASSHCTAAQRSMHSGARGALRRALSRPQIVPCSKADYSSIDPTDSACDGLLKA